MEISFAEDAYYVDEDTPTGLVQVCAVLDGVLEPPTEAVIWLTFRTSQDTALGIYD